MLVYDKAENKIFPWILDQITTYIWTQQLKYTKKSKRSNTRNIATDELIW
jgi:hypothetical protein